MGHLDGTCPGQCPGHVQDIEIFLGHCPVPALPLGGFLLLFGALHIRFCPCRCSFGFGLSFAWFSSVPVLCTSRYTLKTIFRVSLRQKTTKPSSKVLRTGGFCV